MNRPVVRRWPALLLLAGAAACTSDLTQPSPEAVAPAPAISASIAAPGVLEISDGAGTAWRQITETVGITWNQAAQLCPRDGINPCSGRVGQVDLTGWVWATDQQVVELLSRYEPAILTSRMLAGAQYGPGVSAFFAVFQPTTTGGCSGSGYIFTCSFGLHASGWTATGPDYGSAYSATIQSGFNSIPMMQIVADPNVGFSSAVRGLFMWRADGTGGTGIEAADDAGQVESPHAGAAVPNVLANDTYGGAPATLAQITLTQVSTTNPGVTLNPADGSVNVAYGVRVGEETLEYRICQIGRPANCDGAVVRVTINGNRIEAYDDEGTTKTGGGLAIADLLANDTFAGDLATLNDVAIRVVTADPGLTASANGEVSVAAGTAAGQHTLDYEICEIANPTNCDVATATVAVTPYAIDAVADYGSAPSGPGGVAVANVLTNDRFDDAPATTALVDLSMVSSTAPGLTLDPSDGSVDVAPGTPAGSRTLTYRICERASPTNCDTAVVSVTVVPQSYVVSKDTHKVNEGSGGSFTVKLSQPPAGNLTVAVSYLAGTMPVTFSAAALTFTPANWNTPQTVTFGTMKDSGKEDNAGTLQLVAPGIATRHIVVNGLDKDRKSTSPMPTLLVPYNGQTVSGLLQMHGTATDSDGITVDGRFSVDGVRVFTVLNSAGTFRPPVWNSATVPNGWHTIEFRVTDNGANDGRVLIKVLVSN